MRNEEDFWRDNAKRWVFQISVVSIFEIVCRIIHSSCHCHRRFESESGFIIRTNRQLIAC
jgi:hypothetical protein